LVVIGVSTPEFEFEHTLDNVRRSVKDMGMTYPIAIDNDYAIWRAFDNNYWPALYFVDAKGRIRHHHFGEGDYDKSERMIQQLLAEAGRGGGDRALVTVNGAGIEAPADWGAWSHLRTTSGTRRRRTSRLPVGRHPTSPTSMLHPGG